MCVFRVTCSQKSQINWTICLLLLLILYINKQPLRFLSILVMLVKLLIIFSYCFYTNIYLHDQTQITITHFRAT